MELIRVVDSTAVLSPETASKIAEFERMAKSIKEQEDALKNAILKEMEANGIVKVEADGISISYVAPYDKETFDTKEFRKSHSALYDEYVRITPVKASVRIRVV